MTDLCIHQHFFVIPRCLKLTENEFRPKCLMICQMRYEASSIRVINLYTKDRSFRFSSTYSASSTMTTAWRRRWFVTAGTATHFRSGQLRSTSGLIHPAFKVLFQSTASTERRTARQPDSKRLGSYCQPVSLKLNYFTLLIADALVSITLAHGVFC